MFEIGEVVRLKVGSGRQFSAEDQKELGQLNGWLWVYEGPVQDDPDCGLFRPVVGEQKPQDRFYTRFEKLESDDVRGR